eukprot:scaffold34820_cov28-Attheya_sp.AAC.1
MEMQSMWVNFLQWSFSMIDVLWDLSAWYHYQHTGLAASGLSCFCCTRQLTAVANNNGWRRHCTVCADRAMPSYDRSYR